MSLWAGPAGGDQLPGTCQELGRAGVAALGCAGASPPPSPALSTPQHPPRFSSDSCPVTAVRTHRAAQCPLGRDTSRPTHRGDWGGTLEDLQGQPRPHLSRAWAGGQACPPGFSPAGCFLHAPHAGPPALLPGLSSGSLGASKHWEPVAVIRPEGKAEAGWNPRAQPLRSALRSGSAGPACPRQASSRSLCPDALG